MLHYLINEVNANSALVGAIFPLRTIFSFETSENVANTTFLSKTFLFSKTLRT